MKTISTIILTCLVGFFLTSCKSILVPLSGLKQPKLESIKSVSDYLEKKKIEQYDTLYICPDSAALYTLMFKIKDFPRTILFDRNDVSVLQSDSGYCPGKAELFMRNLSLSTSLRSDDRFSMKEIFQWVHPVVWNSETTQDPDFTLFVFWAKYCGSLNNSVFRVMKGIQENPNIKTRIYLVNIDFMDSWDLKSKPEFTFK
ncbi:MAG: hypothetical protein V1733_00680 [bacterium]